MRVGEELSGWGGQRLSLESQQVLSKLGLNVQPKLSEMETQRLSFSSSEVCLNDFFWSFLHEVS